MNIKRKPTNAAVGGGQMHMRLTKSKNPQFC